MKKTLFFVLSVFCTTLFAQSYCTTNLYSTGCSAGDDLDGISLGAYTQTGTSCGASGYADFTASPIPVVRSSNYYIFTATTNYTNASEYVGVWIDWNSDGDFDDPTEFMLTSSNPIGGATPTYTDSMLIDNSRPIGIFRMRVRVVWNTQLVATASCTPFTWGETHDYAVEVKSNVVGNCANAFSNFKVDSITGTGVKVNWTPGTGNSSFFFEYGPIGFTPGSAAGTKITGTYPAPQPPIILTGLTPQTTYDFYFGEICNSGADSVSFPSTQNFTTTKACAAPLNFTVSQITASSIQLNWTPLGNPTYKVIYDTTGFDPNVSGNVVTATAPPYILSGLSPATLYDVYLYADCGGTAGVSDTLGPRTFKSLCVPYQAPDTNNFDSEILGLPPSCWEAGLRGANTQFQAVEVASVGSPRSTPNHLDLYNYFTSDTTMAITPQYSDLPAGDKQVSFYAKNAGGANLIVGTIPNQTDLGQFHPLDTFMLTSAYGQEYIIYLDSAHGYNRTDEHIAFLHANNSTFSDVYIDDYRYEAIPPCPKPIGLTLVTTGDTFVVIGVNGLGGQYDFTWGPTGFNQASPGTGYGNGTSPFTINTLLYPGGTFDVYVRSDCDTNGLSVFTGPLTFTTNCTKQTLPYIENFNINLGCMKPVNGGASADTWEWQPAGGAATPGDLNGTGFAGVDSDEYGNGVYMREMLESPPIDASNLSGTLVLQFDQYYNWIGNDSAVVQVFDGTQWHTVLNMHADLGGFANPNHQYINVNQYANADFQVRFLYDDGNSWAWFWLIDNFSVREVLCSPSSNLVNSFSGPDSATFNWIPGDASTFLVEYGLPGFTPGTGTITMVTDTFVSLTNLIPQTEYQIYIVDSCQSGFADTLGPITFKTSCLVQSLPYTENFNVDLGCMQAFDGGTSTDTWEWQPSGGAATPGDLDGSGFAGVDSDEYGISDRMFEMLVSPPIDAGSLPATSALIVEFDQFYNWIGNDSALVQVFDGTQWHTILSMHKTYGAFGQPDHRAIDVTQYASASFQVRFVYDDANSWAWYWLIDNLKVKEALCGIATNPQVASTSVTSAQLTWTSGGGNWNINWGPAGFTQASGTGNFIKNVTSNPYTLTGLTGSTCYDYYVQDTCLGIGSGNWAGPFTFCTQCLPYILPYKEEFASATLPNCFSLANSTSNATANWIYATTWPGYGATGVNNAPGSLGGAWGVDGSTPNDTSVEMYSPTFILTGANLPYLKFRKFQNNVDIAQNMTLYVDVHDGSAWNNGVLVNAANSPTWVTLTMDLTQFNVTGPVQFRFRVNELTGNPSPFYSDLLIDDIELYDSSAVCPMPANLSLNPIACDSIQVSWTGASDSAIVGFAAMGTFPTGATLVVNDSVMYITGTTANTSYDFYVSNICGGDTSLPVGPITVNTGSAGAPVANVNYSINGLTVNFDGTVSFGNGNSYSWDFGNSNTANGGNPTHTFTSGGSKTITLTVTNACGTDDTTFTIAGISLEELAIGASVALFPNPVKELLQLEIELENDDHVEVQILSTSGQVFWQRRYEKASAVKDAIDFSQLADGVYMIKIETSKGSVNRRIVKQ